MAGKEDGIVGFAWDQQLAIAKVAAVRQTRKLPMGEAKPQSSASPMGKSNPTYPAKYVDVGAAP